MSRAPSAARVDRAAARHRRAASATRAAIVRERHAELERDGDRGQHVRQLRAAGAAARSAGSAPAGVSTSRGRAVEPAIDDVRGADVGGRATRRT